MSVDGRKLDERAMDTIHFINFMDQLFDSVNATKLQAINRKPLYCAVAKSTTHFSFWNNAKKLLSTMHFVDANGKTTTPPSLKNWIVTLTSIHDVFTYLNNKYGISFLRTRFLNQDPLENFFGQMRQHGGRNINPSPVVFAGNFKTLLINNYVSSHSLGANCENEESHSLINNVKQFLNQTAPIIEDISFQSSSYEAPSLNVVSYVDKISVGYISGFITKKIRSFYKCTICKDNIICKDKVSEWHDLVVEKEFSDCVPYRLRYCTPNFIKTIYVSYKIVLDLLPTICFKQHFYYIIFDI